METTREERSPKKKGGAMNAERDVHADDLTPQQLEEIYVDQTETAVEQEDGEPVADDEQLDTDLIDKQFADPAELNAGG